jgi:hypothetical protein
MEQESVRDIYDLGHHLGHSSVKVINLYLAWVARQSGTENAPNRHMRLAEGMGFEPTIGVSTYNGLANRRLQPLGHPSAGSSRLSYTAYAGLVIKVWAVGVNDARSSPADFAA